MNKTTVNLLEAYKKGYRVNDFGDVFSHLGRKISCRIDVNGRKSFSARVGKDRVTVYVHRLMAYQKYGDKMFDNGIEVRHLNGNPLDNSLSNIEIGTHSENMRDIPGEIRIKKAKHASSFLIKHNSDDIKRDQENGMSYSAIMRKYNISSKGTVSYIIKNR